MPTSALRTSGEGVCAWVPVNAKVGWGAESNWQHDGAARLSTFPVAAAQHPERAAGALEKHAQMGLRITPISAIARTTRGMIPVCTPSSLQQRSIASVILITPLGAVPSRW